MKKRMVWLLLAAMILSISAGCGKKEEEPVEEEPVVEEPVEKEPEEEPEEVPEAPATPEGMARSYLTGEWIDQELAGKRPLAVMIGNTSDALPQYGISSADIIYEVPVEGSYTRLMAISRIMPDLKKLVPCAAAVIILFILQGNLTLFTPIMDRQFMRSRFWTEKTYTI